VRRELRTGWFVGVEGRLPRRGGVAQGQVGARSISSIPLRDALFAPELRAGCYARTDGTEVALLSAGDVALGGNSMRSFSILGVLAVSLAAAPALAGTLDGKTPAEETVCDVLHGAKHGLYGLCVAYCEAQDCSGVDAALAGECVPASRRLLELYEGKRGAGDPPMPCIAPPTSGCPCYSTDELDALELGFCYEDHFDDGDSLFVGDVSRDGGAGASAWDGQPECLFIDPVTGEFRHLEIDEEEWQACTELLEVTIEHNGLVCEASEGL
jgi:hypothetical protein